MTRRRLLVAQFCLAGETFLFCLSTQRAVMFGLSGDAGPCVAFALVAVFCACSGAVVARRIWRGVR
jgi:hypothetical protein